MCVTSDDDRLIFINKVIEIVCRVVGLPVVNSPKQPNKDNSLITDLEGIDIRAYRQGSLAFDEMFVMEFRGGDPTVVKKIINNLSHKNVWDKPFISSINVKFKDGIRPPILINNKHFVMYKNGWNTYYLYDLDGISAWERAIKCSEELGVPDNDKWSIVYSVSWLWTLQKTQYPE